MISDSAIYAAAKARRVYQDFLREEMGRPAFIDEVAYAFADLNSLHEWTSAMVRIPEVVHFNGAEDKVRTEPLGTAYGVQYEFFSGMQDATSRIARNRGEYDQWKFSDFQPWRVEAMCVMEGYNPVYEMLRYRFDLEDHLDWPAGMDCLGLVHLSYKLADEVSYREELEILKRRLVPVMECTSNYGLFSYWKIRSREHPPKFPYLFIKPRVNLRDS